MRQFPGIICRVLNFKGQRNRSHLCPGAYLAVNARVVSGDVLLNVAIGAAHQVGQVFDGLVEGMVRPLIKTVPRRIAHDQAL